MKRTAAIHDISGIGKCSLTVALPVLSCAGIETNVIPTALLSTHTGGFDNFTYKDLTDEILPIAKHWAELDIKFDSIYTGYLGSVRQVDIVLETFDLISGDDTLIVVDPVMADGGVLYKNFDENFPNVMKKLCKKADIILPNITEACLLTNTPYIEGPYSKDFIENLIEKLKQVCDKNIVLTGVHFDSNHYGCACFDKSLDTVDYCFEEYIDGFFHGTGDLFGSVFLAAFMCDKPLVTAAQIAQTITVNAIRKTKSEKTDVRFGVHFEEQLPLMMKFLGK